MANKFHEIAFTPAVKRAQEIRGSRSQYAKFESGSDRNSHLGDAEADFIEARDGFYLATVGETGHPYIQFRGGPPGFLKVLDETTLGFADFRGNLQYISMGNLTTNKKAALILMDYANRRRLKILAEVDVYNAAERPDLIERLSDHKYEARIERAMLLHVEGFEWNCPQHITPRYTMNEFAEMAKPLYEHISRLEDEIGKLKAEKKSQLKIDKT